MIKQEEQNIDTSKTHRKQGGAFDTLASLFRSVKEIVFQNGFLIRNRPSEETAGVSDTVFEIFSQKAPATGKINNLYIGRRGIEDSTGNNRRNINYVEITANHDTSAPKSSGNGRILLSLAKDGIEVPNSSIVVQDISTVFPAQTGTVSGVIATGDNSANDGGGAEFVFVNTGTDEIIGIRASKSGLQFEGIPDNSTGLPAGAIWRDGTTLKIVT
jgi:hypothetical protein